MNIQSARIVEVTVKCVTGLANKQWLGTSDPMVVISGFNGDFPSAPTAARSKPAIDGIPDAKFDERFYFVVPDSCVHFGCFVYDSTKGQKGAKMGSCRIDASSLEIALAVPVETGGAKLTYHNDSLFNAAAFRREGKIS